MPQQAKERQPRLGEVLVEPSRSGWFFVQVGRHKGIKRFNLSDDEARQLIEQICASRPDLIP